jgi:hypothetical protein
MEGRVEAGDLGELGTEPLGGSNGGHGRRVVQGSEVAQPVEAVVNSLVEPNSRPKLGPSVHHPVADGIDADGRGQEASEHPVQVVGDRRQIVASLHAIRGVEDPELEAARSRVHHQNVHRVSLAVPSWSCHPSAVGDRRPFLKSWSWSHKETTVDASSAHIAVHPGDGLVGRFGDTVLLIAGPVSEEDPFVEELVATVEAGSAEGARPGAALAQRIGELLFRAGSAGVASFGVVTPVEGGALVLLHGDVDADIGQPSGATRLSGRQAVTWVDHVVRAPFDRVALTQGDSGRVAVHPRSDLRVGVVPGAGFVLTPTTRAPARAAPSVTPVGAEPDDQLLPTEVTEAATAMPDDELMAPVLPKQEPRAPFDQAEDITPPQAGSTTVGGDSPPEDEDGPAGPSGRAAATTALGGAPPELVGEDGSRTPLDGEYVLGREPSTDEAVRSRHASPLQVEDPDQLVSRVHAHLWVDRGVVVVRDASSANGTFVAAPGAKDWTRVGQEGAELAVGWSMRVGGRIFTLEPGSPVGRPSSQA